MKRYSISTLIFNVINYILIISLYTLTFSNPLASVTFLYPMFFISFLLCNVIMTLTIVLKNKRLQKSLHIISIILFSVPSSVIMLLFTYVGFAIDTYDIYYIVPASLFILATSKNPIKIDKSDI
jgi:ABC-type dipeptide/oligopeptide/nickel transport system permease component